MEAYKLLMATPPNKALIIPSCNLMPAETLDKMLQLAHNGATVIFQNFPNDVPGLSNLEGRRKKLKQLIASVKLWIMAMA